MPRKIESYRAKPPQKFQLPAIPKKAQFTDKFPGLSPNPEQSVVDPEFQARFLRKRASSPSYHAMSVPEFIVMEYLETRKHWKDGIDFKYQYNLFGGRTKYGGFVLDFFITRGQLAWNVQGLKYHLEKSRDRAKVQMQDAMLSGRGFRVISLWEGDLIERPDFTLEAALRGQSTNRHSDNVGFLR